MTYFDSVEITNTFYGERDKRWGNVRARWARRERTCQNGWLILHPGLDPHTIACSSHVALGWPRFHLQIVPVGHVKATRLRSCLVPFGCRQVFSTSYPVRCDKTPRSPPISRVLGLEASKVLDLATKFKFLFGNDPKDSRRVVQGSGSSMSIDPYGHSSPCRALTRVAHRANDIFTSICMRDDPERSRVAFCLV